MNVVMTGDGRLVEVQATAEGAPFTREELDELLDLAVGRDRGDRAGTGGRRLPVSPLVDRRRGQAVRRGRARRRDRSRARAPRARSGASHAPARLARLRALLPGLRVRVDGLELLPARRNRLRPDTDRGPDRHRDRLPRCGRDHPPGSHRARPETAATLWLVAGIGMASGAGYWEAAFIATIAALVTLWPLRIVAHRLVTRMRPTDEQRLVVELAGGQRCSAGARRARGPRWHGLAVPALGEPRGPRARRDRGLPPSRCRLRRSRAAWPSSST